MSGKRLTNEEILECIIFHFHFVSAIPYPAGIFTSYKVGYPTKSLYFQHMGGLASSLSPHMG